MAKYIFLNIPAWGHVNPTLPVAQELVRRGHDVSYYLTEPFRATVEATGATFQPYKSLQEQLQAGGANSNEKSFGQGFAERIAAESRNVLPQVMDRIRMEQPDAILYDFVCAWARDIIQELHIPAISLRATYASNEHFDIRAAMRTMPEVQEFIKKIRAQEQQILGHREEQRIQGHRGEQQMQGSETMTSLLDVFSQTEPLNIIFMLKAFQPQAETFDAQKYVFTGPCILPRHQDAAFPFERLDDTLPLLYISLGTMASNQPEFYQLCFDAFRNRPWQVVLSIGRHVDPTALGPVPDNFLLSPSVPQLDILPRTRVFVTHGGTNSIMESIYYGVPMVLVPQQPEQQLHAHRAVELGLGVTLSKQTLTAASLREAVESVASDSTYHENAAEMQKQAREAGGYRSAADAIIRYTQVNR